METKSLFTIDEYRKIVRNWVESKPGKGRGQYVQIAEFLGLPTSVLSQILNGQRELSTDHAFLLGDYMGLLPLEKEYFLTLVQLEKASHYKYKEHIKDKLKNIRQESMNLAKRVNHEKVLSTEDQQEFYSSWIYAAIGLKSSIGSGVSLEDLQRDFALSKAKLIKILDFLTRTGMIELKDRKYKMGIQSAFIGREAPMVVKHHTNWRIKSLEKASDLESHELMFTAPLTCSEKDFTYIREKLAKNIQEISSIVKDSEAEKLVYFGVDFYQV